MKKTLVSALTTALVVGAASTTFAAANPFADVPADHWAYDAVAQLASDGVVNGYPADGQFKGDATMTRYEMAQIVAKAMAKADSTYANKAMLDKLAAEFADELANLGVRVAALENKVDNVKWDGLIRYEYKNVSTDNKKTDGDNTNQTYLRLNTTMQINENWEGHARLNANMGGDNNQTGDVSVDRAWAEGHYTNFTVKIGKMYQWDNATRGLLMDNTFSGVEVDFGKTVQVVLAGGRAEQGNDTWYTKDDKPYTSTYGVVEVRYVGEKFDIGAGYRMFKAGNFNNNTNDDSVNVWNVGAGYRFNQDWAINGAYAKASGDTFANDRDTSYRFAVQYGQMDPSVANSFDVILSYRKMDMDGMNKFGSGDAQYGAFKGWGLQVDYAPIENIVLELEYAAGTDFTANTAADDKKIFYGKVEFLF